MNEEESKQTTFKTNEESETTLKNNNPVTSTGLKQNLAGMLCYLVGIITGIIFILIEKENQFVRYHAIQSIVVSIPLIILNFILTAIPIIGWAIGLLLTPVYLILWIFMMWKAYQNKWFKIPIAGDIAENQLNKNDE